jgi:hypothetical protein
MQNIGMDGGVRVEKKKGGCLRNVAIISIMACSLLIACAMLGYGLQLMGYGGDNDEGNGSVVVIPSRTPAGAASETPIPLPTDTPIPLPTDTPAPASLIESLNAISPAKEIVQAEVFELAERAQIVFIMGQDLAGAEAFMLSAICAARPHIPNTYGIRFAGDRGDGIELMTAIVDAPAIQALSCPPNVEFSSIATEYSVSEGLR